MSTELHHLLSQTPISNAVCRYLESRDVVLLSMTSKAVRSSMQHELFMDDIDVYLKEYFPDPKYFRKLLKAVGAILEGDIVSEYRTPGEGRLGRSRIFLLPGNDVSSANHELCVRSIRKYMLSVGAEVVSESQNEWPKASVCRCSKMQGTTILDYFVLGGQKIQLEHQSWRLSAESIVRDVNQCDGPVSVLTYYGSHVIRPCGRRNVWRDSGNVMRSLEVRAFPAFVKRSLRPTLEYMNYRNLPEIEESFREMLVSWAYAKLWREFGPERWSGRPLWQD
jgi:hypothetical protein